MGRRRVVLTLLIAGALLVVLGGWLLWKPDPVGADVRPEDFGADGTDTRDDTQALLRALDALEPGGKLILSDGASYRHSAVLTVRVDSVTISGGGTLLATNEKHSALVVDADQVTVEGITLTVAATTKRWDAPDQMKLAVLGRRDVTISGVDIQGSAAAGIFVSGTRGFTISDVSVNNTRADGIHMTGGAQGGALSSVTLRNPGDDGVAVVSYASDSRPSGRITVDRASLYGQTWGRAFSVIGGRDVTWRDLYAEGSAGAALYIASEESYDTMGVEGVRVENARFVRSNTESGTHHGAVLLYSGTPGREVRDVSLAHLEIADTSRNSGWDIGMIGAHGGRIEDVTMDDITFTGGNRVVLSRNLPVPGLELSTFTRDGKPVDTASL